MNAPETQRIAILEAVTSLPDPHRPIKLREISIRLSNRSPSVDIMRQQAEDISDHGEIGDQIYVAKGGKIRNRHGMEKSAIQGAQRAVNFPDRALEKGRPKGNGSGPRCFRCGSYGHLSRNSHLPPHPLLAFGGPPNAQTRGSKKVKPTYRGEVDDEWHTRGVEYGASGSNAQPQSDPLVSGGANSHVEDARAVSGCDDVNNSNDAQRTGMGDQYVCGTDEEWRNQWRAGKYHVSTSPTASRSRPMSQITPSPGDAALSSTRATPLRHALLGSGSSYSAVWIQRIHAWRPNPPQLRKQWSTGSHKQFRCGIGEAFSSLGSVLINAVSDPSIDYRPS